MEEGSSVRTILCDLEAGKVVDLLPDREAATVAAWLQDHPGTEIVSRDRASAYAEATRSLLIWLFQQDTTCSVAGWLDRHFRRTCANSSRSSPPKTGAGHTWLPVDGRTVLCVPSAGTEVLMN